MPCSWQQFHELQLRPGATHATQQQFYEVQLGPGITPAAVYRDARLRQFNEVLYSDGGALLQAKGEGVQAAVKQSGWTWWSWGQAAQAERRWRPSCC